MLQRQALNHLLTLLEHRCFRCIVQAYDPLLGLYDEGTFLVAVAQHGWLGPYAGSTYGRGDKAKELKALNAMGNMRGGTLGLSRPRLYLPPDVYYRLWS